MSGTLNTCEAEYAKDSKIQPEDIRSLMEWIEKDSQMPNISEYQVIQFYHACRYSIQRTKQVLKLHYTYKNEAPEIYTGQDFNPLKYDYSFWDLAYCFDLPKLSSKGYRITYAGLRDVDPAKYNFQVTAAMQTKFMATVIMEQGICDGYSMIYDYKGFSLSHLSMVNFTLMKKYSFIGQETCQLMIKEIHLINGPGIIDKFMMFIKPFLKKEVIDLIHVHHDMKSLFDHFGQEVIPIDLGGTLPQTREELNRNARQRVESLSKFVQTELDKHCDTDKSGYKQNDSTISYESFKKISID